MEASRTLWKVPSAHDSKNYNHCESIESKVKSNSQPKDRPQLKKKRQISHIKPNVGLKRAVDGETRHKCEHCHYATNIRGNLTRHMRIHIGEKPYKCQSCKYATAYSHHLVQHIRIHTGEKPFKCCLCKYATAQRGSLIQHNRIHTGKKPFKCRFCQYASNKSSHLNTHVRGKHKDALKVNTANSKNIAEHNMVKNSVQND